MTAYSDLSKSLTKTLSTKEKKEQGIFFTPPSCVETIMNLLGPHLNDVQAVLEPSCGSGEFITAIRKKLPQATITGVEYNTTIYNAINATDSSFNVDDNINLYNEDFLSYVPYMSYQLIIGNPPFNVLKKKDVATEYHEYFSGRPNIFILFIVKCIKLLSDNGILCFVLPKNFLNCQYYNETRAFISRTCDIISIQSCDGDYIDTKQDTIVMVLRKGKRNTKESNMLHDKHVVSISGLSCFTSGCADQIKELYKNSSSLNELGFKVSVGKVVWNQNKKILCHDTTATRLIYSSDFKNGTFAPKTYKNEEKKNFIRMDGKTKPVIMMNRGYGTGAYTFDYCILDIDTPYLLENHVICIEYLDEGTGKSRKEMIDLYTKVVASFNDERTKKFIGIYIGNNAISTTELATVLPIYKDHL